MIEVTKVVEVPEQIIKEKIIYKDRIVEKTMENDQIKERAEPHIAQVEPAI